MHKCIKRRNSPDEVMVSRNGVCEINKIEAIERKERDNKKKIKIFVNTRINSGDLCIFRCIDYSFFIT